MLINYVLFALSIPAAILLDGFRRKLIARLQNRIGPPLIQPFRDLIKLFGKRSANKNSLLSFMPLLAFVTSIFMLLILCGVISFQYDFILFVYLFIAGNVFLVLGALSSKSPFSFQSAMRDFTVMIGYETVVVFCVLSFMSGQASLSLSAYVPAFRPVSWLLLVFTGLFVLRITPYDTVSAETEVGPGLVSEYSGRQLMFYEFSDFLHNFTYYALVSFFLVGGSAFIFLIIPSLVLVYALSYVASPRYSFLTAAKHAVMAGVIAAVSLGVGL